MRKRLFPRLLAVALALALSIPAMAELPDPEDAPEDMILGEERANAQSEVSFYYKTADGTSLVAVRRVIEVASGETALALALDELLSPTGSTEYVSVATGDAKVIGIEFACGIATVNLSVDVSGLQSGQDLLMLYTAVGNTLMSIDGVEMVNILIGSRQESVYSLPMGVMTVKDSDATVLWAQILAEEERFLEAGESATPLTRTAALYFPSLNGQWILPEARSVSFQNADYASQLLDELIEGSVNRDAYANFLSGGVSVLAAEPLLYVTSAGERVLDIYLTGALRDYLILQGISEWQMAASIALTMCSFIPELDAVALYIDGTALTELNVRGNVHEYADGLLRRGDFSPYVGGVASLYFSDGDGGLAKVARAMSARRALSAYSLVLQLISGPSSSDDASAVMPTGVSADDVLGVSIDRGVATVNFSSNFYRLCQTLDADGERSLVYAVVNTLCELPDVSAVVILIEGERVETLANEIYLKTELMPNTGMVEE